MLQSPRAKRLSETYARSFHDCWHADPFEFWIDQPFGLNDELKAYVKTILDDKLKEMTILDDSFNQIRNEVESIKNEIQKLKRSTLVQDVLTEEWDNEYDEWWNTA